MPRLEGLAFFYAGDFATTLGLGGNGLASPDLFSRAEIGLVDRVCTAIGGASRPGVTIGSTDTPATVLGAASRPATIIGSTEAPAVILGGADGKDG